LAEPPALVSVGGVVEIVGTQPVGVGGAPAAQVTVMLLDPESAPEEAWTW
jgi:hypothetical protein